MSVSSLSLRHDGLDLERRSQAASSFFIPDSSPMVTFSRDDWVTGYAAQPNGYDQTLHMTGKSGSRVNFNIAATSFSLLVPAFENCTSIIVINDSNPVTACSSRSSDGSSDVPFSLYSLPLGIHTVYLDTGNVPEGTQVIFWGVDGNRPADPAGHVNVTIDDTFTQSSDAATKLEYQGTWQSIKEGAQTDLGEKDSLDKYFNKTVAITTETGASVSFTGKGSAVYLYGNVGPEYGAATLSVNDQVAEASINLTSPWPMPYELIWYRTGLDPTQQTEVVMTNIASSKMSLDFVLFTTDPDTVNVLTGANNNPTSDSFADSLAGKVVLFFLIPAVALTLFAFTLFMLFRRRRKRQAAAQQARIHSQASDVEFKYPSHGAGDRDRDRWSDEPKSSRYSSHSEPSEADLVFVSYDEGKGQRMSEHWTKALSSSAMTSTDETAWNHEEEIMSPRSGRSAASRSPPMEMRTLSVPQSVRGTSTPGLPSLAGDDPGGISSSGSDQYHGGDERSLRSEATSNWPQPFQSIITPRYPASVTPTSRRGTLPAYTLDDDDVPPVPSPTQTAMGTENATNFSTAEVEKQLLQTAYSGYNTPATSQAVSPVSPSPSATDDDGPGPSSSQKRMTHQTHTSNAPSIMSVFGSPPSEARRSVAPTPAPRTSLPKPPTKIDMAFLHKRKPAPTAEMAYPPTPSSTSSAKVPFPTSPESTRVHPKSSTTAAEYNKGKPSLPPSSFQAIPGSSSDDKSDTESTHRRKKSLGGISTYSAARPESVSIPFHEFVQGLDQDRSRITSPIENDCFGPPPPPRTPERKASPFDDDA